MNYRCIREWGMSMRKVTDGFWKHRGYFISRDFDGYTTDCSCIMLNVYKTLSDVTDAINEVLDSTNKTEPRIIGEIFYDESSGKLTMKKN